MAETASHGKKRRSMYLFRFVLQVAFSKQVYQLVRGDGAMHFKRVELDLDPKVPLRKQPVS